MTYYEGILQFRRPRKDIFSFIAAQIRKEDVKIVKEVSVPEGVDLYVTSRKFLRTLAGRLKQQFGGEVNLSSRLQTMERTTGKRIYRVALLYRAPALQKGDIVQHHEHVIKITNVGKHVTGIDVVSGKRLSFLYTPSVTSLPKEETRVIKTHPVVEILHPQTYQPVVLTHTREVKIGEKVTVVALDHVWYLVSLFFTVF